jgi:hypothetical protein
MEHVFSFTPLDDFQSRKEKKVISFKRFHTLSEIIDLKMTDWKIQIVGFLHDR